MIISHDRFFLDRVCTHILAFEGDGETVFFEGTYSEYERERKKTKGQTLLEQTRGGAKFARLA
jgi:ATPase subunit of ABC transporter with duplicated ATPase domains